MNTQLVSYGLPSLFALVNAAALIYIKRWVERRDAQAVELVRITKEAADQKVMETERLRLAEAETQRLDRAEIREQMREENRDLREQLANRDREFQQCRTKLLELEQRVRELERAA